ncbi:hypothetical protein AB4122_07560 [Vibrio cyclitrophicus]|uniref:hypothetical protein n=1 Tax=Vibrio sp. R78045 TaxID=3093868 RepID=UPI0035505C40
MELIDKLDVADEYLELAIECFLHTGKYASAIHLAGAAQELYGKWLRCNQSMDLTTMVLNQLEKHHKESGKEFNRKDIIKTDKRTKNSLKHMDNKEDRFTQLNLKLDAFVLLAETLTEHRILERQVSPRIQEFTDHISSMSTIS